MAIPFLKGIDVTGTVDLTNLTVDGAQGTDGQVLTSTGSGIAWEDASGGTSLSGGAANKLAIWSGTDALTNDTNLHWDTSNNRLGIGDSTPSYTLDVNGTIYGSAVRSGRYYGTSGTSSYLDLDSGAPYSLLASSEISVTDTITCNDLTATEPGGIAASNGPVYGLRFHGYGNTTFWVDPNDSTTAARLAGGLEIGYGSSGEYRIEVGEGRTGNGYAYIDFVGDTTYSDYGLRLIRNNTGANASSQLLHRGSGNLEFKTSEAGTMIFSTSNSERMRIGSAGNVGINTTNPSAKLDITQTATAQGIKIRSSSVQPEITFIDGATGDSFAIGHNRSGSRMDIEINGTDTHTFKQNGNVGIGTTSPGVKLDVVGEGTFSNYLNVGSSTGIRSTGWVHLHRYASSLNVSVGNNGSDVDLYVPNGSVGIGTASPAQKLHVTGKGLFQTGGSTADATTGTYEKGITLTGGNMRLVIDTSNVTNGGSYIQTRHSSTTYPNAYYTLALNPLGGKVGIGTSSPSHEFHVMGTGQASDDFRSQIFYDSNNTSYYANPNGRSNLSTLVVGSTAANTSLYGIDFYGHLHMHDKEINYVSQLHFNDGVRFVGMDNNSYLKFKWNNTGSGGIRFYDGGDVHHGYIYGDGNGRFGLLDNDGNWAVRIQTGTSPLELSCDGNTEFRVYNSYVEALGSSRAPIFYDSDNTNHYVNPASTSNSINIAGRITGNSQQNRIKYSVWSGDTYGIGMKSGFTYGHLNDYAMSFQMNDDNDRGFWWGDAGHTDAQGAMSLTTNGKLTVATSLSVGQGQSVTSPSSEELYVNGSAALVGDVILGTYSGTTQARLFLTGTTASKQSIIQCTNGNLHIDSEDGHSLYLNYYEGATDNVIIGNGNGGASGTIFKNTGRINAGEHVIANNSVYSGAGYFVFGTSTSEGEYIARSSDTLTFYSGGAIKFDITPSNGVHVRDGSSYKAQISNSGVGRFANDVVAYYSFSDKRLKTNIKPTTNNLDKVLKLNPVEYNWKEGYRKDKKEIGLIAQEVEKIIPEVIKENKRLNDDTSYKQVDYEHLVSTLIGAVQEQQKQIDELKSIINGGS